MKNSYLLNQVTPNLRKVFQAADLKFQVHILPSTIRTQEQQADYVRRGTSKTMNSKHLIIPGVREFSEAVDAAPLGFEWPVPFDWKSVEGLQVDEIHYKVNKWAQQYQLAWSRLYYFAGRIVEIAASIGVPLRYGGDWDGDLDLKDQNWYDGVHFEEIVK